MLRSDDDRNLARDLSPAMREALRWLPADGTERRCQDNRLAIALARLRDRGLCGYLAARRRGGFWRLTAAGQALRAEMDRPEEPDAER
jgi:hypothetical protein